MSKPDRAFTLIELLVVISIISFLSSVVLAAVGQARVRARDAWRISLLDQTQKAIELYGVDHNGTYPNLFFACAGCDPMFGAYDLSSALSSYIKIPATLVQDHPSGVPIIETVFASAILSGPLGLWYFTRDGGANYLILYVGIENPNSIPLKMRDDSILHDLTAGACDGRVASLYSNAVAKTWDLSDYGVFVPGVCE